MNLEHSDSGLSEVRELRARAARYNRLADILTDPRCIAVARATARELEEMAASLDSQETCRLGLSS